MCVHSVAMRDPKEAHYLHDRRDIDPVMSPPIDEARVLDWFPDREELLVGAADGGLYRVDPIMGTRTIADDLDEPGAMAISPDGTKVAVVSRGHGLEVRDLSTGNILYKVMEPLLADLWVGWWEKGVCFAGEGIDGRRALVVDRYGVMRTRLRLPDGAVVGVGRSGGLLLGRVSDLGLEVLPLGHPMPRRDPTRHRLRFSSSGVVYGIAEGGVTVWLSGGRPPNTIRVHGATSAAVSGDGQKVAIGTRAGGVTLAQTQGDGADRCHPGQTGGHEKPVQTISFSTRGRWFATAGEACWLWSY